jgi:hypothetical protein
MFATIFCGAAGPISSKCSDTSHATPVLGGQAVTSQPLAAQPSLRNPLIFFEAK